MITIDAGDTVVWALNTDEIHAVAFTGTCDDISCIPPCAFTVNIDVSPCGSPSYDGFSALDSSGRMVPAAYNWDNSIPTETRPGVCGAPAPATGIIFSQIFVPPAFTLNNVTAGPDGRATSLTVITGPPNSNGPGQLGIPSSGWFINVAAGRTPDDGATSGSCGNVVFHNASAMRYLPQNVHIHVGDDVVWTDDTSNEPHGVTFLAGQPLPQLPEWYTSTPTGNGGSYDGSSFFNSGLRPPQLLAAPSRQGCVLCGRSRSAAAHPPGG